MTPSDDPSDPEASNGNVDRPTEIKQLQEAQKIASNTKDRMQNRQQTRFRTIFGGQARYQGRSHKCLIFDLSEGGAKLEIIEGIPMKEPFDLFIDRLGAFKAIKAEAMWVRGDRMGIRFTEDPVKLRLVIRKLLPSRYK